MSREIRQIDKASGEFGYKLGYLLATIIFWGIEFIFKLIGKLLFILYHIIKALIIRLKIKFKNGK
jgi:hypothetical protein